MSPSTPWEEALGRLLERFDARLQAMSREMRLDPSEREALIQEVRLRLWKAAPDVETLEGVGPSFLYKAARWAALDLLRERRGRVPGTQAPLEMAASLPAPRSADEGLERGETGAALERAVAALGRDRGTVVSLWLAGHHRTEIVSLLGWGEHRVRNLLYRGLEDLREALAREGITPSGTGVAPGRAPLPPHPHPAPPTPSESTP